VVVLLGWLPDKRRVRTANTADATVYEVDWDYHDYHRWYTAVTNTLEIPGNRQTVARHAFPLHDNNGNVLQQMADGLPQFAGDDREFQVNRLNQLIGTNYTTYGQTESVTLDAVGNLESRTDRTGTLTDYISPERPNAANEYRYIGGVAVQYDPAGNLSIDEAGRHYYYDEQNRLVEVRAADDSTVLASYDYDALGRRIEATIGGVTTRYYYTGQQMLEERDASDARLRYHIPGCQYVDEQIATYTDATGRWEYYLLGAQFNVIGRGNADGSAIEAVDYASSGDFAGRWAVSSPFDFDRDLDVDRGDFMVFQDCFTGEGGGPPDPGCEDKDLNHDSDVDEGDFAIFEPCVSGTWMPIDPACLGSDLPASGSFAMHGLMVDVLPDGKTLLFARARHYDPQHARWLQRDPLGFVDGPNLYEAFGGNALVNVDPAGTSWFSSLLDKLFAKERKSRDAHRRWVDENTIHNASEFRIAIADYMRSGYGDRQVESLREVYARDILRLMLSTALSEGDALELISDRTKQAGDFAAALSSGAFSGANVRIAIMNGSDVTGYQLVPLDSYAQAWDAQRTLAAMPEHNCAALDAVQFGVAFVPGGGPPTSALTGVMHGGLHAWYGDQNGAGIRFMTAPLALAGPAEAGGASFFLGEEGASAAGVAAATARSARSGAIRSALSDANGNLLSAVERQGLKFTIRRVEAQGYSLTGAIKYSGNQGIDLAFAGTGTNAGRFALAEAKASAGLGSLRVDSLGIRQGSVLFFDTRLGRAGELALQQQLQAGNVDLFGGFAGSGRLFQFDPVLFRRNVNFRTTPGAARLVP
jgi:RHS repeat-associated protein